MRSPALPQPRARFPVRISRRRFAGQAAAALGLAAAGPRLVSNLQAREWTAAESFDETMEEFLRDCGTPGGALAVVRHGRLVHARGYGRADRDDPRPVRPDSLFRIASLSKPVTAVAVLRLAEQNKLDLEARPYELLGLAEHRPAGTEWDSRWSRITVRQLLQHTGGWDRDRSFDPMFRSRQICRFLKRPEPAQPWDVIDYMLGQPLDFDPGTRYAYSNFGYCLLGRLIETVTGRTYEAHIREAILEPLGIRTMRLGRTRESAPGEVRYHMPAEETASSVFEPDRQVPWPYGGFHLEAMDAHGGWIASVVDLARFAAALDEKAAHPLLRAASIAVMHEAPPPPVAREADGSVEASFYGGGWQVRPKGGEGRVNAWHTGSLPGTYALLVRRWDGISYAALFNQRSADRSRDARIDPWLYRAADRVEAWPEGDSP